jgi:hypothetical protein
VPALSPISLSVQSSIVNGDLTALPEAKQAYYAQGVRITDDNNSCARVSREEGWRLMTFSGWVLAALRGNTFFVDKVREEMGIVTA